MKLFTSTATLAMALAAVTQAAPKTFDWGGVVTEKGGFKCTGSIHYTITDDAGGDDIERNWELDGCLGGTETLDDGTFTIDIDRDAKTSVLTENSSGLTLEGTEGEHRGPIKVCTAPTCPPATTMTCVYGAGPDIEATGASEHCGLT